MGHHQATNIHTMGIPGGGGGETVGQSNIFEEIMAKNLTQFEERHDIQCKKLNEL